MRCEAVLRELDRYRTGEIPQRLKVLVDDHLRSCPECGAELTGLRSLAVSLAGFVRRAPALLMERVLEESMDKYGMVETGLGAVWIGFSARGITMVYPGARGADAFVRAYRSRRLRAARPSAVPARYADLVLGAAEGRAPRRLQVDLDGLTPFEQKTLLLLRHIPRGEVRSYSWVAREAGNPKAARAVGTVMKHNPVPLLLPCHRVVPSQGGVGKYAFGSGMKRSLLEREGVPVAELEAFARDGVKYLGCKSTGIYCFPTCRDARRMRPENRLFFRNVLQATQSGFRPCQHCRP